MPHLLVNKAGNFYAYFFYILAMLVCCWMLLIQGCFGATIGKAKQGAKTEIEKIKVLHLIMLILHLFMYAIVWRQFVVSYNDYTSVHCTF